MDRERGVSQLCDEAGQGLDAPETCLDRLTDVEQSEIASQLVDLAPLVRCVNANENQFEIEWTERNRTCSSDLDRSK
jgi:hypothetical protein